MRKPSKAITIILIIALLGVMTLVAVKLRGYCPQTVLDYGRNADNNLSLEFTDTQLIGRKDGKKLWQIRAKRIRIDKDQVLTQFDGIQDGTVYQNEKPVFHLKAGYARYNALTRFLEINQGVDITSQGGYHLKCNSAKWDGLASQLRCPGKIILMMPNGRLTGRDLEMNPSKKLFTLQKVKLSLKMQLNDEVMP